MSYDFILVSFFDLALKPNKIPPWLRWRDSTLYLSSNHKALPSTKKNSNFWVQSENKWRGAKLLLFIKTFAQ
jgi:hypothetical protein